MYIYVIYGNIADSSWIRCELFMYVYTYVYVYYVYLSFSLEADSVVSDYRAISAEPPGGEKKRVYSIHVIVLQARNFIDDCTCERFAFSYRECCRLLLDMYAIAVFICICIKKPLSESRSRSV